MIYLYNAIIRDILYIYKKKITVGIFSTIDDNSKLTIRENTCKSDKDFINLGRF